MGGMWSVVDATDFDGSFPSKVVRLVSETIEENLGAWKQGMVVTRIDFLPTDLSPASVNNARDSLVCTVHRLFCWVNSALTRKVKNHC